MIKRIEFFLYFLIFFMSSEAGNYNVYSVGIDGNGKQVGTPTKITSLSSEEQVMRSYSIFYDGKAIVFEQGDGLFLMTEMNGKYSAPKKVSVKIRADQRNDASEMKTVKSGADEYTISPNGKFNYSIEETMKLELSNWVSFEEFVSISNSNLFVSSLFGDIYFKSI